MSLITIDRTLVTQEQNSEQLFNIEEDSEAAVETGSKSSHSEDFFVRKTSAVTLSVKSHRRISVVRDHDNLHEHLKRILQILRFNDYVKLIVKLESGSPLLIWYRYLAIISTVGSQNTTESVVMGIDVHKGEVSIGFILPIYQDMVIKLDGDGGFKLITKDNVRLFKPISVQALWAAHQAIMQSCKVSRQNYYHSKGPSHGWISHYKQLPTSKPFMMFEWNRMEDIEDMGRASPPKAGIERPVSEDERKNEQFKNTIRLNLQRIMGTVDLEDVNVVQLREMLEKQMGMSLKDQRQFIADQVLTIYGQMDVPSFIFDHLLLGSSFNASNGDELRRNNVTHIVNVTREVDNFFPSDQFVYKNIRVYDDEKAQLLPFWDETFKFINEARANGTRCLVHCKMGISRSGSTVVAYVMKEKGWKLDKAMEFVKSKRPCVNPNANFLRQLETYQGILEASSHRHSALFQQAADKVTVDSPSANVLKSRGESSAEESTVAVTKMEVGDDYEAYEPPPGPSGPVDLEAELFAFKTFPQLQLIQEELADDLTFRRLSSEPSDEGKGIRRRVLATTSQRIRHWHPDIYEDMGSAGSGVVIGRSKSSPTRVFHRASVATKEPTSPQFAVPLVASARSSLNTSTITTITNNNSLLPISVSPKKEVMEGVGDGQSSILIHFPPAASPTAQSEEDSSSISEHDVLLVPTTLRSQNSKKTTPSKGHPKTRPVIINIIPSTSGNRTFNSSSVNFQAPSAECNRPSVGRLTLSLGVMAPDEGRVQRPVRSLSLRLRPDDSWIMKRHTGEERDDSPRRPLASLQHRCPISETAPTTTPMTPPEEVEESRRRMGVVRPLTQFQNPLPTVIAASQQ